MLPALLLSAVPAPAPVAVPAAAISDDMLSYYRGERTAAYLVLGLGLAYAAAGAPLVAGGSAFARGLGVPLLSMGLLETVGGIFYAFQVTGEIRRYGGLLGSDPASFREVELAHLAGTQRRFVSYRAAEIALTVAGLGLASYGFAANADLFKGVGAGLFAVGLPLALLDAVNDHRAGRYREELRRFDPAVSVAKDEHGWRVALSGRY